MDMTFTRIARSSAPLRLALAAAAAAAVSLVAPAWAETSLTVTAGTAEAEAGIKSYEVSTETEPVTDDTYWFCQVVGKPSIAGSVTVATANGNTSAVIRHAVTGSEVTVVLLEDRSFFVIKAGTQVASLIPAPPGSGLPSTASGFASIAPDPAWNMFVTAIKDSNLRTAIIAQSGGPASDCQSGCAIQHPLPSDCGTVLQAIYCCQVMADRDYCEALCDCEASGSPKACQTLAATRHLADWLACGYSYIDP